MAAAAHLFTMQTLYKDLIANYDPKTNWADQCLCKCSIITE